MIWHFSWFCLFCTLYSFYTYFIFVLFKISYFNVILNKEVPVWLLQSCYISVFIIIATHDISGFRSSSWKFHGATFAEIITQCSHSYQKYKLILKRYPERYFSPKARIFYSYLHSLMPQYLCDNICCPSVHEWWTIMYQI